MKLAGSVDLTFYMENPLRSKLWTHPLIRKWIQNDRTQLVQFDYCQFGERWMKPTQIMAFNNKDFNPSTGRRCKREWLDKTSICSKTGSAHEVLSGLVPGTNKFKTAVACPYPHPLCNYWAPTVCNPQRQVKAEGRATDSLERNPTAGSHDANSDGAANAGGLMAIQGVPVPDEHYRTHLPKHPGCLACTNCKMQITQRRDKVRERQRRRTKTIDWKLPGPDKDKHH